MKILVTSKFSPEATEEKLRPYIKSELSVVWKLYAGGYIREWYSYLDRPGAVLILECASVEVAKQFCDEFPIFKAGLMQLEFIPLGPFLPIAALFKGH